MIYAEDSLFTLTPSEQAGVLAISAVLTLCCVVAVRRSRGRAVRLGVALALFWAFVWLSPQVYYTYYRVIFEGLPVQSVVKAPGLADMARLMGFAGPASLSTHGQGALGWLLIAAALWRGRR